jgi:hypothetical protein
LLIVKPPAARRCANRTGRELLDHDAPAGVDLLGDVRHRSDEVVEAEE